MLQTKSGWVEYRVAGEGDPILYFHGTGAAGEIIVPFEQPLLDSGFQLVVPNRPGYYGTPLLDRRSPSACARMACGLLDHLGLDRVAVMGSSGGGPAASRFAAEYPNRTACLVLQCAQAHRWDSSKWLPQSLGWSRPLFHIRILRPLMRVYNRIVSARRSRRVDRAVARYRDAGLNPAQLERAERLLHLLAEACRQCALQPAGIENDWDIYIGDNWLEPGEIHCPTLVIHDPNDSVAPFVHAEWVMQAIEDTELCGVATGHLIWLGPDAERMHDLRVAFLRRHMAKPSRQ